MLELQKKRKISTSLLIALKKIEKLGKIKEIILYSYTKDGSMEFGRTYNPELLGHNGFKIL